MADSRMIVGDAAGRAGGLDLKDVEARKRLLANPMPVLTSAGRGWAGLQADLEDQPAVEVRDVAHSQHVATLCLCDGAHERRMAGRSEREQLRHGLTALAPAGQPMTSLCAGRARYLNVLLDPALVKGAAPRGRGTATLSAVFLNEPDPGLSRLLFSVLHALEEDSALADLRAESLGVALARHLLRHHSDAGDEETRWNHGLTAAQLRRVEEVVAARPAERLTVQAMADTVGLSLPHFTRQFRHATGQSPYQYILRFRLDQARRDVLRTSLPVSAIAADLGFADEAHLCNAFRRRFGYTPGSLRNGRLTSGRQDGAVSAAPAMR